MNSTPDSLQTGMIGLGAMGTPIARNLHRATYLHGIWNRSTNKSGLLGKELGIPVFTSPEDLASKCPVIVISVSADSDLLDVVDQLLPGITSSSVVIDTSTVNQKTAITAASTLAKAGASFLDAPVSGGVEGARKGTLAMMVGGNQEVLASIMPILESVSSRVQHMGPIGAGQATKAVNQVMAAGINQAVTEALAFGKSMGLPLDKVIEIIGSGAAGNWFLQHRGPTMTSGIYDPGFTIALHRKDLEICKAMAEDLGVAMPVVEMTLIHYRRLIDAGYGEEDISALFREKLALFENSSGRPRKP